uniref:HBS1-like protein n=2 Tax=Cajanus cajan TaxID=3821 RepID=A0A151R6T8_CAJCA|nr:HBS1-like protein [Cajanus cajan]
MTSCDICGVVRHPLLNIGTSNSSKTVEDISKSPGASKLARSLFQSLPQQIPKEVVLFPKLGDGFLADGSNFYKLENVRGEFHEIHKAFSTQSHPHLNIDSFKFDVPSPDDVVYSGLHSSKMGLKDKVTNSKSSQLSSSIREKNELSVQSNVESLENLSSLMRKSKQESSAVSKLSKNVAIDLQISGKTLNSLPESLSKDKGNNINKINSSKNGTIDIQSSKEKSGSLSASTKIKESDKISLSSIKDGKPESNSSSFNNMVLDVRSGNSSSTNAKGSHSHVSFKPEKWMLPQQAEDTLTQLNLAIVGHVDSGKSTLSGRLLHLLGRISQKEMHKYEKEAKLQGKGSFAYAWALDESSEERERGITMTVAVAYFDTKRYHVVVLDSPGHKDFVPNMISGATQADAAILVIDASLGSFEAGMDGNKGQTREHAQLIRSFGVDRVIVAINKMDAVEYSKDRFDFIRQQLGVFLHSCGFKASSVSWIPMSAMENQNLVASPSDARFKNWYGGPYLLDAIDSLKPPTRDFSKPLLMPICDVIKSTMLGQVSACGKLEAGALRSGSKVLVMPSAVVGTVRSLERDSNACTVARAGDNVAVTLQGVDGSHVMAGGVLCHPDFPVAIAKHLELKVLVLDGASPILMGAQLEFHIHHAKEPARVSRILSLLDPKTGKITKKSPRCLTAKQSAVIEVILNESVCVVEFSTCKALGRVSLRSLGRTIAVGVVTRIIEEQG